MVVLLRLVVEYRLILHVRGNDVVDKKTGVLHSPIYDVVHRPPDVSVISKDLAGLQQLWLKGSSP